MGHGPRRGVSDGTLRAIRCWRRIFRRPVDLRPALYEDGSYGVFGAGSDTSPRIRRQTWRPNRGRLALPLSRGRCGLASPLMPRRRCRPFSCRATREPRPLAPPISLARPTHSNDHSQRNSGRLFDTRQLKPQPARSRCSEAVSPGRHDCARCFVTAAFQSLVVRALRQRLNALRHRPRHPRASSARHHASQPPSHQSMVRVRWRVPELRRPHSGTVKIRCLVSDWHAPRNVCGFEDENLQCRRQLARLASRRTFAVSGGASASQICQPVRKFR